jgi:hypothetical protein
MLSSVLQKKLLHYQQREPEQTPKPEKFKFSTMLMCCGAQSSGGASIDIAPESRQAFGLSREPSFSVFEGNPGDDTLKLV